MRYSEPTLYSSNHSLWRYMPSLLWLSRYIESDVLEETKTDIKSAAHNSMLSGADLGGVYRLRPPFWRRIYYMTLSFYCKKVVYQVSKHQKVSKGQKYAKKSASGDFTTLYLHNITRILKLKHFRRAPLLKISVSGAKSVDIELSDYMSIVKCQLIHTL